MIVDPKGQPALAKEIKDRLQQIDERLGVCIAPMPDGTIWGVTCKWDASDPRRAEVQRGERAEEDAFDVLCWLPKDCPVEQAYGYIVSHFTKLQNRDDVRRMLERVHKFNDARKAEILKPTRELVDELVGTNARHMFKDIGKSWASTLDIGPKGKRDEKDWNDYLADTYGAPEAP